MTFADAARRLAGVAGWLLHWPPDAFWAATPAELATIFTALTDGDGMSPPPDAATLNRLKEMFPDGSGA